MVSIGVLASGRGSNLEALVRSLRHDAFTASIRLLISNNPDAGVLKRAAMCEVPSLVINHRDYKNRRAFEDELLANLERHEIDLVCLAGFMRILSPAFIERYRNRVINIHPSLLPAFAGLYGADVHRAAIDTGVKITGCTVHFVTEDLDAGPIIIQRAIPVREEDSPESLALRVLIEEHKAYPEAVNLFALGMLKVEGRRVHITKPL